MNKVLLMGRITKDVELRTTQSGTPVASFTIAVNRRFAKEGQQNADFLSCVAWRQQAEFIVKHFGKGKMIAIVGNLQSRSWEGQDGKKQYATDVVVDEVYFTGEKKEEVQGGDNSNPFAGFQPVDTDDDDLPF
jgi:single-strand DNA-binding protein